MDQRKVVKSSMRPPTSMAGFTIIHQIEQRNKNPKNGNMDDNNDKTKIPSQPTRIQNKETV